MGISNKTSLSKKQLGYSIEDFPKKNDNKRIILVDDEQDILFTYKIFLKDKDYDVISFIDPVFALNYIRNLPNFKDLLIILDVRMKNLNGIQLYQQIKSIDPTIKILFITVFRYIR